MYQVIIVDDEPRILEGIIHLFPWNNFGFEVVASFTNGKEALEYINAHPQVDIVMTDIHLHTDLNQRETGAWEQNSIWNRLRGGMIDSRTIRYH